jgi:ribonuclease-3
MSDALAQLQTRIGYPFRDAALLRCAVTHTSFLQDHPAAESNQRLEFLGDAVLQLLLTEALYHLYPVDREGLLSKRRAALANGVFLARLAREISLDGFLARGAGEDATGGRARAAASEDAFEALLGAVYLDSDLATARRVLLGIYGPLAERLATLEDAGNPKGRLQELIQPAHGNSALRYDVVRVDGADHAREYAVSVFLLDRLLGTGCGTSKKLAEESAARAALETMAKA